MSQRRIGVVLGYANIVVKNLVNLVYTPMLLFFVGQADYGVFQTTNSFIFSLSLLSFGFSGSYVRFYARTKATGTEADVRCLNGLYFILYAVVCAVALALGLFFASHAGLFFSRGFTADQIELAGSLMQVMAANIAVTLFSTIFDGFIIAHEAFAFQQTRQLFMTLAMPLVAFFLLSFGMGAFGVAAAQLIVSMILLGLNARFAIIRLGMRFDLGRLDFRLFREVAAFSGWIFINQVCDFVNQSVPNVLLGAFTDATTVAVFAVSVQIRNVFMSLSVTMSNVFIPKINGIVTQSNDNGELTRLMTYIGRYQMVLFCWVYGGFVLLGQFFIDKWAGGGFADAYWLIVAMTLPLVVPLTQNTGIEIQRAKNMHRARSIAMLFMAIFNVAFTFVASSCIGYWAPALGYIASIVLGNGIFMNWYYHKKVGMNMLFFWRRNLPVLLAGAVAMVACSVGAMYFPIDGWLSFFAWGFGYTVLFGAALWLLVLDLDERKVIASRLRLF